MIEQISKFALLVLVVAILFLLFSGNLLSSSPFVIAGQLVAVALGIWARRSFPRGQFSIHAAPSSGPLLSNGPYRLIRHPMYAAALLLVWSSVFGHLSLITVAVGLVVSGATAVRIVAEERLLGAQYSDFAAYAHTTKLLIPYLL